MKEQIYKIENQESFELKHIFDCGQCFRWNEQEDMSYTGVFKGNVLNVKKENNVIIFKGMVNGDIKEVVEDLYSGKLRAFLKLQIPNIEKMPVRDQLACYLHKKKIRKVDKKEMSDMINLVGATEGVGAYI